MTIKRGRTIKILGRELKREKVLKPGYIETINFDQSSGYDVPKYQRWIGPGFILEVIDNESLKLTAEQVYKDRVPEPRIYTREEINTWLIHMIDMNMEDIIIHYEPTLPSKER